MTIYSLADAKRGLSSLIDLALQGDEVIISRHGKPVAELRPMHTPAPLPSNASYDWLRGRRDARPAVGLTSVQLLGLLYDAPET